MPRTSPLLPDQQTVVWIERLTNRGCFVVDAQRNIVAIGPMAEQVTGCEASRVVGRDCLTAVRCHRCVETCAVMEKGMVHRAPLTLFQKDGGTIVVFESGVAIHDDQGDLVGAVELVWQATADEHEEECHGADRALDQILRALGRLYLATDRRGAILRFSTGLRSDQLRRSARSAPRERAVRSREGSVHGRNPRQARALRGRRGGHPAPRRDRRHAPSIAGQAAAVCEGQTIHPSDLPDTVVQARESRWRPVAAPKPPHPVPAPTRSPSRADLLPRDLGPEERDEALAILEAMRFEGYRKGKAAERLGMSRTTLWRKLEQYRIG